MNPEKWISDTQKNVNPDFTDHLQQQQKMTNTNTVYCLLTSSGCSEHYTPSIWIRVRDPRGLLSRLFFNYPCLTCSRLTGPVVFDLSEAVDWMCVYWTVNTHTWMNSGLMKPSGWKVNHLQEPNTSLAATEQTFWDTWLRESVVDRVAIVGKQTGRRPPKNRITPIQVFKVDQKISGKNKTLDFLFQQFRCVFCPPGPFITVIPRYYQSQVVF